MWWRTHPFVPKNVFASLWGLQLTSGTEWFASMYEVAMLEEPVLGDFTPSLIGVNRVSLADRVRIFPTTRMAGARPRRQQQGRPIDADNGGPDEDGMEAESSSTGSEDESEEPLAAAEDLVVDPWVLSDDELHGDEPEPDAPVAGMPSMK